MNEDVRHSVLQNTGSFPKSPSPSPVPSCQALELSHKRSGVKKRSVQKKSRDRRKSKRKQTTKDSSPDNSNFIPIISFALLGALVFVLSQSPGSFPPFSSSAKHQHPFIQSFEKALQMIEATDISWVSEISQRLLETSNLIKDVTHFTQKFALPDEEVPMQILEQDFLHLSGVCKDTYKLGFNVFAEARTFTKTCSRRLDLVLSVARDDRLNNARELLARMSETLQAIVQDHDRILDNLSSIQQQASRTLHRSAILDVRDSVSSSSGKVALFSLSCLSRQAVWAEIRFSDEINREAREAHRISSELSPTCELFAEATENLLKTRTSLHSFHLQLKHARETLTTKVSLSREDIGRLELLVDDAKAFLERLCTKYEDLVSNRS